MKRISVLVVLFLLSACITSRVTEKRPSEAIPQKSSEEKKSKTEKEEKIKITYPVTEDIRNSKDYDKFQEFLKLLQEDPTLADAHYNIGVIYSNHKEFSLAAKAYEEALKIRPDYVEAAVNLADAYKELGKYGAAEAIVKRVLRENPDDIRLLNALAIIYRERGELDESLKLSLRVLKKNQKYLPARINIGLIYLLKKKYAMAYYVFDTSKDIDPDNPTIHEYKGYTLYFLGDLKGAEEEFTRAMKLNPGKPELYVNMAIIRMKQEKWKEAEEFLKKALKIKPLMGEAHLDLGVVYLKLGKLKEAYKEFKKAIKYGADKATAYYNLAIVASLYRRKPDIAVKKAIEYLKLYLKYAVNIAPEERKEIENLIKDIKEIGVEVVYLYKPKFSQLPPYARPKEEGSPQFASAEYGTGTTSTYSQPSTYTSPATYSSHPATTEVSREYGGGVTSQINSGEGSAQKVTSGSGNYPKSVSYPAEKEKMSGGKNYTEKARENKVRKFPSTETRPVSYPGKITSGGNRNHNMNRDKETFSSSPESVTGTVESKPATYPEEVSPVEEAPAVQEVPAEEPPVEEVPPEESTNIIEDAPEAQEESPPEAEIPEEPEEISPETP